MGLMRALDVAVQFLTVFKVRVEPPPDMAEIGRSVWAFPVAGALIGVIVAMFHYFLVGHFPALLLGILAVGLWIALTGGLHLDGWADCCDALVVPASPERRLQIMKDSRVGTFGATGLILLVAVKSAVVGAEGFSSLAVFLAPMVGRASMIVGCSGVQTPARGMAAGFIKGLDPGSVRSAALIGFAPSLAAGWVGLLAAAGALGAALWFRRFAQSRLTAINGDVMGAMCELSEAVFLVLVCWR